jgi:hypothetical protein
LNSTWRCRIFPGVQRAYFYGYFNKYQVVVNLGRMNSGHPFGGYGQSLIHTATAIRSVARAGDLIVLPYFGNQSGTATDIIGAFYPIPHDGNLVKRLRNIARGTAFSPECTTA